MNREVLPTERMTTDRKPQRRPRLVATSIAMLAGTAVFPLSHVHGAERGRAPIEDRNGVVLYSPTPAKEAAAFPYRALASHVLEAMRDAPTDSGKLSLTLDARIQFAVEEALRTIPRGAAVVLDAQTGDILAMASVPSFDPNALTDAQRKELGADSTAPLTNRAIQAYAPGSIFMPVTALAGIRKGMARTRYNCPGGITYGDKYFKCWISDTGQGGHGTLAVDQALKNSCGSFFYQFGNAAGIDRILETGTLLGLGTKSGLPLPGENAGILPGPSWLKQKAPTERWSAGYTANTSIGQGYVTATPVQMARVAATIGNGQRVPSLRLRLDTPATPPVELRDHGVTPEALEPIRQGMRAVVEEGTGKRAQVEGTSVAGTTGTAQYWRLINDAGGERQITDNRSWFIAYAPADKPKLALCVLVEGAKSGGGVAAPLAARIIEKSLKLETIAVKPLQAAKGSFEPVEEVR